MSVLPALLLVAGVVTILLLATSGAASPVTGNGSSSTDGIALPSFVASNSAEDDGSISNSYFTDTSNVPIVPSDANTWPGGDSIWDVCRAIAQAEGYGPPGNAPTICHNPGDISDYGSKYGYQYHGGSNITTFPDDKTGWQMLYQKLDNIRTGKSTVYSNNMSWTTLAQKWAGSWQNWVNNVTNSLGVSPTDRVGDYWNA